MLFPRDRAVPTGPFIHSLCVPILRMKSHHGPKPPWSPGPPRDASSPPRAQGSGTRGVWPSGHEGDKLRSDHIPIGLGSPQRLLRPPSPVGTYSQSRSLPGGTFQSASQDSLLRGRCVGTGTLASFLGPPRLWGQAVSTGHTSALPWPLLRRQSGRGDEGQAECTRPCRPPRPRSKLRTHCQLGPTVARALRCSQQNPELAGQPQHPPSFMGSRASAARPPHPHPDWAPWGPLGGLAKGPGLSSSLQPALFPQGPKAARAQGPSPSRHRSEGASLDTEGASSPSLLPMAPES